MSEMKLIKIIEKDLLTARKEKNKKVAFPLTALLSEAKMIGKNKRNGDPLDEEVVAIVKKFIKGVQESINLIKDNEKFKHELILYQKYLPIQLSEKDLKVIIQEFIEKLGIVSMKDMGKLMGQLKKEYSGQYDGKLASNVFKKELGQ